MAKKAYIERIPEPEVMDDSEEAGVYDAADFNRVNRSCARRICKLRDADRGHALDLGTGPAEIPIRICTLKPGWKITAVDASPSMLRLARRSHPSAHGHCCSADAQRLRPLPSPTQLLLAPPPPPAPLRPLPRPRPRPRPLPRPESPRAESQCTGSWTWADQERWQHERRPDRSAASTPAV